MGEWEIVQMTGFRINSPYMARDPKCPKERHPTRNCGCRVFKTKKAAQEYIDHHEQGESNGKAS